jgi:periplasmic copper chaperone A
LALVVLSARSQTPALTVQDAWARHVPGSDVASVYLTLRNSTNKPITIVSVESPAPTHAMIHESKIEGGQSRMRPHDQLVVPPGETVKLQPEGLHVMLMGVPAMTPTGTKLPVTFQLADGSKISVTAAVRPLTAQ